MKKIISLLMAVALICSIGGCKSDEKDTTKENNTQKVEERAKKDAENSADTTKDSATDDNSFENDEGKVKYVGMEKAVDGLLSDKDKGKNIWVMKYEFTNYTEEPKQLQFMFNVSAYQNGVELDDMAFTYNSSGGEQYKLVGNYFTEVMDGGTVTFGRMVELGDESSVKIIIKDRNGTDSTKFSVNVGE